MLTYTCRVIESLLVNYSDSILSIDNYTNIRFTRFIFELCALNYFLALVSA